MKIAGNSYLLPSILENVLTHTVQIELAEKTLGIEHACVVSESFFDPRSDKFFRLKPSRNPIYTSSKAESSFLLRVDGSSLRYTSRK